MRRRIITVFLALPICGRPLIHSFRRRRRSNLFLSTSWTPVFGNHVHFVSYRQGRIALTWLPTSPGSSPQKLSGPFTPDDIIPLTPEDIFQNKQDIRISHNCTKVPQDVNLTSQPRPNIKKLGVNLPLAGNKSSDGELNVPNQNISGNRYSKSEFSVDPSLETNQSSAHRNEMSSSKSYYGSMMETYFPFLQSSTYPPKGPLRLPNSSRQGPESNKQNNMIDATIILDGKSLNDTITVTDLQKILTQFQKHIMLSSTPQSTFTGDHFTGPSNVAIAPTRTDNKQQLSQESKKQYQVAFPQPSVLSYRDVQRGTIFASGVIGMVLGATILPNLWLVGMLSGSIWGFEISKEPQQVILEPHKLNVLARWMIYLGRKIAINFLKFYDHWKTLWFLYKTGQLSYEYYKRYEILDQRFQIQNKLDAWNRRFVEGKKRFDAWEQENEVGRTILAGLRTVWLVDEQSRRRTRKKSQYRIVQALYDVKFYVTRSLKEARFRVKAFFEQGGVTQFISELRTDLESGGSLGARISSVLVALALVNTCGALFSISPGFSNLLVILLSVIWPSWASSAASRFRDKGEALKPGSRSIDSLSTQVSSAFNAPDFMRRYDRRRYNFFIRLDGTKRYYRTGQSMASTTKKVKTEQRDSLSTESLFANPFRRAQTTKSRTIPEDGLWGILQRQPSNR